MNIHFIDLCNSQFCYIILHGCNLRHIMNMIAWLLPNSSIKSGTQEMSFTHTYTHKWTTFITQSIKSHVLLLLFCKTMITDEMKRFWCNNPLWPLSLHIMFFLDHSKVGREGSLDKEVHQCGLLYSAILTFLEQFACLQTTYNDYSNTITFPWKR